MTIPSNRHKDVGENQLYDCAHSLLILLGICKKSTEIRKKTVIGTVFAKHKVYLLKNHIRSLNIFVMAFENFPEQETKYAAPSTNPQKDWKMPTIIALAIALIATWGYLLYDKSQHKEIIQQKDNLYATAVTEKDTLQAMLDEATMRYDELKTANAKQDSTITAKDREIAAKQSRIRSLLAKSNATAAELAEAKRLIVSLNTDIESYKEQVEVLKGENMVLTQEKAKLTEEKGQLSQEVAAAKTSIKEKEDQLDVGSTLHASNFTIVGIDERRSGKEKETAKAKRVDKIRISFNIDINRISASGTKELYVCITGPDGKPLAVAAMGSGVFTTREGEEKTYTQKVTINYIQGQPQTVSFDWKQNSDYETGNYKIEVYQNGFKIGEGTRSFKKGGLFS